MNLNVKVMRLLSVKLNVKSIRLLRVNLNVKGFLLRSVKGEVNLRTVEPLDVMMSLITRFTTLSVLHMASPHQLLIVIKLLDV